MTHVIDVRGLSKRFGGTTVVDNFEIKVPKGAIYGFLGPNGSGKTTTIRLICGLLKADSGEGTCLGFDVMQESACIKERVGYMTQRFSLYEDLTIKENLMFMARLRSLPNTKAVVEQTMEDYSLTGRAHQYAGQLSGGWKQRLALAATSMHNPQLLLLDEPTAGVDPKARRDFWDQIRVLANSGVTVLVSTHYMDEAVQCDDIAFIAYGKKLIDAPSGELADRVGLTTLRVEGTGLRHLHSALNGKKGIDQIARFGSALHISGLDKVALEGAVSDFRNDPAYTWSTERTGLEEAFIYLMSGSEDNFK